MPIKKHFMRSLLTTSLHFFYMHSMNTPSSIKPNSVIQIPYNQDNLSFKDFTEQITILPHHTKKPYLVRLSETPYKDSKPYPLTPTVFRVNLLVIIDKNNEHSLKLNEGFISYSLANRSNQNDTFKKISCDTLVMIVEDIFYKLNNFPVKIITNYVYLLQPPLPNEINPLKDLCSTLCTPPCSNTFTTIYFYTIPPFETVNLIQYSADTNDHPNSPHNKKNSSPKKEYYLTEYTSIGIGMGVTLLISGIYYYRTKNSRSIAAK